MARCLDCKGNFNRAAAVDILRCKPCFELKCAENPKYREDYLGEEEEVPEWKQRLKSKTDPKTSKKKR